MTSTVLLHDLARLLRDEFTGYSLLNKAGIMQQVQVYEQFLPQPKGVTFGSTGMRNYNESDYESNFPCIIVKLGEQTDMEERAITQSNVAVKVITGVYDDTIECQGYKDVLAIQDKIRLLLMEHRIAAGRFLLNMPVKSRLSDTDTWPVYFGEQDLTYEAGRPAMRQDYIYRNHEGVKIHG